METKQPKIVCISFYDQNYSRASVYLNSNYAKNYGLSFKKIDTGLKASIRMIYRLVKHEKDSNAIFVVLSPSHFLVLLLRLFWRGKIVLDAGWPLTDATISRGINVTKLMKLIKSLFIDVLSFQMASNIILESAAQSKRVARLFRVRVENISVLFTGFDENSYSVGEADIPEMASFDPTKPVVTFRGSANSESGLEIIAEMSNLKGAESFNLLICTNSVNSNYKFSSKTLFLSRRLSIPELTKIFRMSQVLIGQISSQKRLNFTIPHKAFEAGFFEKPYISIDRPAIRELYKTDCSVCYNSRFDASLLLESILGLLNYPEKSRALERSISLEYREKASQELLGQKFIQLVLSGHSK